MGLLLILLTYFYYPYINKDKLLEDQFVLEDLEKTLDNDHFTAFENVKYEGLTNSMQKFSVKSENAYILDKDPNLVFMKNMLVEIYLNDGRTVRIRSDAGRYHKVSHDSYFQKNVVANDGETKIFAENLDLLATEDSVTVYNNVFLTNDTGSLRADNVHYDFKTKYYQISMFSNEKVKIKLIK